MEYHSLIQHICATAAPKISQIPEAEMAAKSDPSKWSHKEVLGHLIDSAWHNHLRFVSAANNPDLVFGGYDQDYMVRQQDYQSRPVGELLSIWVSVNQHLGNALKNIPEDVMHREATQHNFDQICMNRIQRDETTTLAYLAWDYVFHLEHHLVQILPDYQRTLGSFE